MIDRRAGLFVIPGIKLNSHPLLRDSLETLQAGITAAGFDGEQAHAIGGLASIPENFGRAHGCAARLRWQQATTAASVKQRVNQLGFTAREFADAGDGKTLAAQQLTDAVQGFVHALTKQAVRLAPLLKPLQALIQLALPTVVMGHLAMQGSDVHNANLVCC